VFLRFDFLMRSYDWYFDDARFFSHRTFDARYHNVRITRQRVKGVTRVCFRNVY